MRCVCVGGKGCDSVKIAIVRITLLSFPLHLLFDLPCCPEG